MTISDDDVRALSRHLDHGLRAVSAGTVITLACFTCLEPVLKFEVPAAEDRPTVDGDLTEVSAPLAEQAAVLPIAGKLSPVAIAPIVPEIAFEQDGNIVGFVKNDPTNQILADEIRDERLTPEAFYATYGDCFTMYINGESTSWYYCVQDTSITFPVDNIERQFQSVDAARRALYAHYQRAAHG